jgi:hypothetical protein
MRNAIPTKEGTAALITAQYDKDGMLKNVVTTKLNNRFPSMGAGFGWNVKMSYTFNFDQENINYAAGDYFKCYIWESSVNTVNGYVHDIIRPMTFNLEKLTPISNIAFTIPDAQ